MKVQVLHDFWRATIVAFLAFLFFTAHYVPLSACMDSAKSTHETLRWYSFEEAVELSKKEPRKLMIDVYTDWCGWCKKMDATTFSAPGVSALLQTKYYAVKLNAETRDTIRFSGKEFVYKPEYKANELALSLLSMKMSYPTVVFLDEQFSMIQPLAGYVQAEEFEVILAYFVDASDPRKPYEEFKKTYLPKEKR